MKWPKPQKLDEVIAHIYDITSTTATSDLEALRSVFDSNGDDKVTAPYAEFAKFKV